MEKLACSLCTKSFSVKRNLRRHMLTHEGVSHKCLCGKAFHRLDVLKKHQVKCSKGAEKKNVCDLCSKSFSRKYTLSRHTKICGVKHKENRMKEASIEYKQNLERGCLVETILKKCPDTIEEALDTVDRKCLKLYQQSCAANFQIEEVVLRPWQKKVLDFIDKPSDRIVYWIVGDKGNEGKTFLQNYIRRLYGSRRVLHSEANAKKADIAYLLSNEMLTCRDIFLFNLLRSDYGVAYGIVESIKDGSLISSKYRSKFVKIKTPNTVIVFSNSWPDCTQLSNDRWKIYKIFEDELHRITNLSKIKKKVNPYESTKNYTAYH